MAAAKSATTSWEALLEQCKVDAAAAGGRKQYLYTFPDKSEMLEEYDANTDLLLLRKFRKKRVIGGEGSWTIEAGEELGPAQARVAAGVDMMVSSKNPAFSRVDGAKAYQFRIRNLPYPIDTYNVTVDEEKQQLVLRTTNKKYFKRFEVPDVQRCGETLQAKNISLQHANNTLVISYAKPASALAMERRLREKRQAIKVDQDGDVGCNSS